MSLCKRSRDESVNISGVTMALKFSVGTKFQFELWSVLRSLWLLWIRSRLPSFEELQLLPGSWTSQWGVQLPDKGGPVLGQEIEMAQWVWRRDSWNLPLKIQVVKVLVAEFIPRAGAYCPLRAVCELSPGNSVWLDGECSENLLFGSLPLWFTSSL